MACSKHDAAAVAAIGMLLLWLLTGSKQQSANIFLKAPRTEPRGSSVPMVEV